MKYLSNIQSKILYTAILSQVLFFSSCSEDSLNWLVGTPINVTASADGDVTRSGASIQTSNFETDATINAYFKITDGDAIGNTPTILTASAPVGGKNPLSPDVQPYYPSSGTVDIYALYPRIKDVAGIADKEVTNTSTSFYVESDQTDPWNYKKSDLMWASVSGQGKTANDVNLAFTHKMAKITINVTGTEGVTIKSVKLINTVRKIAVTGIATASRDLGNLDNPSNPEDKVIVVASSSEEDGEEQLSGSALFPPQPIAADFIEVVTNYGTTKFSTNKTFAGGKEYKASLTITRQVIGFTSTITDWTADDGTIAVPPGSSAGLIIQDIPSQQYTGEAIEPSLSIAYTLNSVEYNLERDVDYTLRFFNNVNMGTATIIIDGKADPSKGDAGITISKLRALKSFNISAATGNISYPKDGDGNTIPKVIEYEYNAIVDNPLDKGNGDGTFTYESTDPTVARVSESGVVTMLKVGSTTIKAHMAADGNYTESNSQYNLTITPRNIKNHVDRGDIVIGLSSDSYYYTGQAFTPAVTVTDKGRILLAGTHYSVAYNNNTSQGTATVTVRGIETGNYEDDENAVGTKTFTITTTTPTIDIPNKQASVTLPIGFDVTQQAKAYLRGATDVSNLIKYQATSGADYVEVDENTGKVTAKAEGTATIEAYLPANGNNYSRVGVTYEVNVIPSTWTYKYTGEVKKWVCPLTGVYQLEALGAQGGTYGGFAGGRGAQIAGQLQIEKNQILYIYVGQEGKRVQQSSETQGGWNGGGTYIGGNTVTVEYSDANNTVERSQRNFCGGGGATDFALQGTEGSGDWNNTSHLDSRILVAGGGGGALYRKYLVKTYEFSGGGGSGGAYDGETGYGGPLSGTGGTLSSPGSIAISASNSGAGLAGFGYGGSYTENLSAGMGGGGWWGGASGAYDSSSENPTASVPNFSRGGSGGGGSSYIWNSTNATYYTGHGTNNAPTIPSDSKMTKASDFYITPTIMTEGARSGDGEARITYMGAE